MADTTTLTVEARAPLKEELDIQYRQLEALDDNLYKYSSVFFTISAALLAFLAQLLTRDTKGTDPLIYLAICFLGYTASICILLIALKGYYTWEIKDERIRALERLLGYQIHDAYYQSRVRQAHWQARLLSISKIRLVFNVLLGIIWIVLILAFPRLTAIDLHPLLYLPLYGVLIIVLAALFGLLAARARSSRAFRGTILSCLPSWSRRADGAAFAT